MADISNRTLAVLVGIAILISTLGVLGMNKTTFVGAAVGQNTTSGRANVSVQTVIQINLVNSTIDFGYGYVNGSNNACVLESNNSQRMNSTGGTFNIACANASGGFGFHAPAHDANFVIENAGNTNISLDIQGSESPREFLCPSALPDPIHNCTAATPELNWSAAEMQSNVCTSDPGLTATRAFNQSINTSTERICTNMNFTGGHNRIRIPLRLVIPRDVFMGQPYGDGNLNVETITFTGTN